ncbi:hypothetical protein [uncultured Marinobacter sp.]|uniref:hypothetical protein n=1 Tax=uncultured Marinobacter sp. TaxID=187379 RepID=UPI0030DCC85C|tara:strand:+ start:13709 stop:14926 length:1218 start_codon:yes stop_codon:yes gene_type:complete
MTAIVDRFELDLAATGGQAGTITEPSLACSGKRIMVTGNWFCSRSTTGGKTWTFIDPYTELPPAGAGFCCDQLVHYCKSRRLWIWLLQFSANSSGNMIRVAVSSSGKPGTWTWWDTRPQDIDENWTQVWLDYPDMAESDSHLLLSFNVYSTTSNRWQKAVVLRLSLDQLKARQQLIRKAWSTTQFGSLRFARGEGGTAIFASLSTSRPSLEIFRWPDSESDVSQVSVPVTPWSNGPYASSSDATSAWMNRLDDRITGGWSFDGILGFAWTASADALHPFPYVRVVRINETTNERIDEPDLWNSDLAWAYPAISPNQRGDVGIAAFCGAGGRHPTLGVGCLDPSTGLWTMTLGAASTHPPAAQAWGDYLDIQADPRRTTYWVASGFTLRGGGSRNNIVPRVVVFKP